MDSLSSALTDFDEIEINCPVHEIPSIGICGDYFCRERRFFCMKCILSNETCITNYKHELLSLSELLYRFFIKQENKVIDLVEINSMMEALKELDKFEITKNLNEYTKTCQNNISKLVDEFYNNVVSSTTGVKNENKNQLDDLAKKLDVMKSESTDFMGSIVSNGIPQCLVNCSPTSIKDYLKSDKIDSREKENFVKIVKFITNTEKIGKAVSHVEDLIYLDSLTNEKYSMDLQEQIDQKLNEIEENIFKKIDELEIMLIPQKESGMTIVPKNSLIKFSSDPKELVLKYDICDTAHKSNSIDSVFCCFKSIKGESYVVWGTPSFTIEVYDLKQEKIIHTIPAAHSNTIFSCRHYLDRKGKRDFLISSSYDRSVKLWNAKDWTNVISIPNAHSGYYIYSVSVMCDDIENKYYIISAAPNEYTKVWDLNGKYLREFGVNTESTYFINTYFDSKNKKYFIINANSADVKSYDFKTGALYKSYKGTPQTWHMSAIVNEINSVLQLIESDGNGNIRIWDFHSAVLIKTVSTSGVNLRGVCLWNDQFLFSSGSDYHVKLYDLKNGVFVKSYTSHSSTVCAIDKIVHPKYGECLISHGLDGKLKLWIEKK